MIGEAPLPSQIENGLLDFMAANSSYVCGPSLGNEEAFKITYAVADNGNVALGPFPSAVGRSL